MEETSKSPPARSIPLAEQADRILVQRRRRAMRLDWPAIERALTERLGYPIRITLPAPEEASPEPVPASPEPGAAQPATAQAG